MSFNLKLPYGGYGCERVNYINKLAIDWNYVSNYAFLASPNMNVVPCALISIELSLPQWCIN